MKFKSVDKYLGNLADSTKKVNLFTLKVFMNWVRMNGEKFSSYDPDQLVDYQLDAPTNREAFEILDNLVIPWVRDTPGRAGYKQRNYATIRGFFKRNRAPLPSDPDFTVHSDKPKVIGDLSIEEVRDIIQNSALQFKAAFLCILQSGMDGGSFEYWNKSNYDKVREQLSELPQDKKQWTIKIDLPGRKKARNVQPYYTFIGPDAIEALRDYLKTRPDTHSQAIIINDYGNPLNRINVRTYWRRVLKRRGFVEPPKDPSNPGNRYGKSLHEVRDVFRTQWQKAEDRPASEVAEFLMGHGSGDSNEYNKFYTDQEYVRDEYLKALPMLQIMSSGVPFGQVDKREIKATEERLKMQLAERDKRIQQLENNTDKRLDALEKLLEKELSKPE